MTRMAHQSLATLSQWKQYAGVVQETLTSLSLLYGNVQWLVAERDGARGRVLLCSGVGPYSVGAEVGWPLSEEPLVRQRGLLFGTPLHQVDGESYLGLWLPSTYGNPRAADLALLRAKGSLLAALLAESEESRRLVSELETTRRDAETDILTGLYNRRGWLRVLAREQARCERYGSPCTLLLVDLDDLKAINDGKGHSAGDGLIRQAGLVLSETIRQPDVVARIGGDEFAILLTETSALSAAAFRDRLRAALDDAGIAASVGWAERRPGECLKETLQRADSAMYAEKRGRAGASKKV